MGYGFIGGLVLLLLALAVAVFVVAIRGHVILLLKLAIPIGALLWIVLRSLRVRFERPSDFEHLGLDPEDANDEREPLAERVARDLSGLPIDLLVVKLGKGSPLAEPFASSGTNLLGIG
jgi:hypothetical protein